MTCEQTLCFGSIKRKLETYIPVLVLFILFIHILDYLSISDEYVDIFTEHELPLRYQYISTILFVL